MKKFIYCCLIFVLVCLGFGCNNFVLAEEPTSVRITLETKLYSQPDIWSEIVATVKVDTVLQVDNSQIYPKFYKVKIFNVVENALEDDVAYVLKIHCVDDSIRQSPIKKLDGNATIKNDNAKLYSLDLATNDYIETDITLAKDTKVRILDGYDKNKEFTFIAYQNADGEIMNYYIKTADLSVKGVNYSVIIAISTLITCVSILLIIFGIKGKKRKKNK